MSNRLVVLSSVVSLSILSLAGACSSSSPSGDADFTTLSQAQLARVAAAASTQDVGASVFTAIAIRAPSEACPVATADASGVVHVTTNCTTESGDTWSGSATLVNVGNAIGQGNDPAKPISITFDHLTEMTGTPDSGPFTLDGTIDVTGTDLTASLDVLLEGVNVHSEMSYSCDATSHDCHFNDSPVIDIDKVGTADLSGTWKSDDSAIAIVAAGKQDLELKLAGDCIGYSVGSESGTLCK